MIYIYQNKWTRWYPGQLDDQVILEMNITEHTNHSSSLDDILPTHAWMNEQPTDAD